MPVLEAWEGYGVGLFAAMVSETAFETLLVPIPRLAVIFLFPSFVYSH